MKFKNVISSSRRAATAAVAGIFMATAGWASTVTVIGDVNASASSASNSDLYENILGDSTSVLFSRAVSQQGGTQAFYNGLAGVTATANSGTVTSAMLANVDLLVITAFFNTAINYAAAEIEAMGDFVDAGGDVLVVLEASSNSAALDGYNTLLSGLGTEIRYTGGRRVAPNVDAALETTEISDPTESFRVDAYNFLSGGDSVSLDGDGNTVVAFERLNTVAAVPLPAGLPLLAFALGGIGLVARRKCA